MYASIIKEINELFPGQAFLSVEDVSKMLGCTSKIIYNWTRRADPKKRPPRISIGKGIRFPKGPFIEWLMSEQKLGKS